MLDKRTSSVLACINELCEEGTYKVIEAEELIKSLPVKFMTEEDGLKQMIKYLKEREYINIKYSDDKVYCLCPLPKGRLYFEQENSEKSDSSKKFKEFLWTAFFGAMAGSIIGAVITAIITSKILS
jgi:hypothetical protein